MREEKNIDRLFRQIIGGYRVPPPSPAWERLDFALDQSRRIRRRYYIWWAAASVLILMAFFAGYYIARQNITNLSLQSLNTPGPADLSILLIPPGTGSGTMNEWNRPIVIREREAGYSSAALNRLTSGQHGVTAVLSQDRISSLDAVTESSGPGRETVTKIMTLLAERVVSDTDGSFLSALSWRTEMNRKYAGANVMSPVTVSKWNVGASFVSGYAFRELRGTGDPGTLPDTRSVLNDSESGDMALAAGMSFRMSLGTRWFIESGIGYATSGMVNNAPLAYREQGEGFGLVSLKSSAGSFDLGKITLPEKITFITSDKDEPIEISQASLSQHFGFLEVPIFMGVKIIDKKLGLQLSGGLIPGFLTSNDNVLILEDEKIDLGALPDLNKTIYSTALSMGLEYGITNAFGIHLAPMVKYSLNPINRVDGIAHHPYALVVQAGLRYGF
ncbi:MAG: outer membrane beta-barrel protein [Bacteroidales bacterium]|nr:outer membrane beta-barrel protein [Bacteroidales bacterium]